MATVLRLVGLRAAAVEDWQTRAFADWITRLPDVVAFEVALAAGVCLRVDWWAELPHVDELGYLDLCDDEGRLRHRVRQWFDRQIARLASAADASPTTARARRSSPRRTNGRRP